MTADGDWVPARDLDAGDRLVDAAGGPVTIEAVAHRGAAATVHNLSVNTDHTYTVATGDGIDVVTHNDGSEDALRRAAGQACPLPGAANTVEDGVSLSLRYKDGWTAAQRAAADGKVAALNDAAQAGQLRVTPVQRAGTSPSSRYRSAGNTVPRGADVDHTIDLQLGGLDDISNMSPLDLSVNRSLGSQIGNQLRGVAPRTCVIAVMIC